MPAGLIVSVVVDVAAISAPLYYVVPPKWVPEGASISPGTRVRVPLHGRSVDGWVVPRREESDPSVEVFEVEKMLGFGPDPQVVELCEWSAHRWAGRVSHFLGTATPPRQVKKLSLEEKRDGRFSDGPSSPHCSLVQLPPASSAVPIIVEASKVGRVLVIAPTVAMAAKTSIDLRKAGVETIQYPDEWEKAASVREDNSSPQAIVGTASAAFARVAELATIVVIDEHESGLQNEGSPTWNARDVAVQRGEITGVPVVLTSPCPSLEARAVSEPIRSSRSDERSGWASFTIVDRREDDVVRTGLYSSKLVDSLRTDGRVLCVLNRSGRASLLACNNCRELATCARCGSSVTNDVPNELRCRRCDSVRPVVCLNCSSSNFRLLRIGVSRAREELEALLREPVGEITATTKKSKRRLERVLVGTEAVLQRISAADVVAFLDFDQELLAPRYRASEHAIGLLAKASRIVGGRDGRVVIQTRRPESDVIVAALRAEPSIVADSELERRGLLRMPPVWALAVVGAEGGEEFIAELQQSEQFDPKTVSIVAASETDWLIHALRSTDLLELLAATPRPKARLRLQVDPIQLPRLQQG